MKHNNPYQVIKRRYITEKTSMLQGLKDASSNKSLARCENPKYTFLVDPKANKNEIAEALEEIYSDKHIRVVAVNTINVKPKQYNRRGRMNAGRSTLQKKAIVTLAVGDQIDE
ncbi:MAG: 50S ribosomal protein L23 [Verrucomicrobia bacterium]|nr:50S ribosomal protein L23 [Verrucomicrobiota bacterium]MBS0635951.1 50S ribosomal protein L23 [Verrucomicrobiota bacterium]